MILGEALGQRAELLHHSIWSCLMAVIQGRGFEGLREESSFLGVKRVLSFLTLPFPFHVVTYLFTAISSACLPLFFS